MARLAPRLYRRIACFIWTSVVLAMAPFCLGQQEHVIAPPAPVVAPVAPVTKTQTPERVPGPATHALTKTDAEAWLDGFFPYALQRGDVAGAVVVVVTDGAVLLQKGYGYSDVGERKPVDPERTLFRPGSVSKLFTWTAVMQLVEQGKLDLDADINTYLDFKIPPRQGAPVTLHNLMTHTAGFSETAKDLFVKDTSDLKPLRDYSIAHMPKRIFPPGVTPAYSNYATTLAGYIVQRTSGEPFSDYIDHHIFSPLGMIK